nr:HEAT repeat domain-containing protein [Saccharibacillus deserti]
MAALEILAQKDYAEAVPRLEQALGSPIAEERLNAARQIDAHGEPGGGSLAHVLSSLLPEETDARVLCQSARILEQGPVNPLHLLIPLFDCPDSDIRREAVFHAGRLPGRQAWAEAFGAALSDADGKVRRAALGALEGIPLPELLPRYERLLHDAEPDTEMRRMVLRRLDEYGERARTLLERLSADEDPEIGREARHKIERLKVKVNKS